MEDIDLSGTRAEAQKDKLEAGLAFRIDNAISNARGLFHSLMTAKTYVIDNRDSAEAAIKRFRGNAIKSVDPALKKAWGGIAEGIEAEVKGVEAKVMREVDPENYKVFIDSFYELYLETKDQIRPNQWGKYKVMDPTGKEKEVPFNKVLKELFEQAKTGNIDARISLTIFERYLSCLEACKILDFKKSYLNV